MTLPVGTAPTPDTIERVRDGRHRALYQPVASGPVAQLQVLTTRPRSYGRESVNRLLIPAGHNLGGYRGGITLRGGIGGAWSILSDPDGVPIDDYIPSAGLIDIPFVASEAEQLSLDLFNGIQGYSAEFGEVYWTRTVQPQTGVAHDFSPGNSQANETRLRTRGGITYVFDRGPSYREFQIQHNALDGTDGILYRETIDQIRDTGGFLWFEHPGSGDAVRVFEDFSAQGDWLFSNSTWTPTTGRDGSSVAQQWDSVAAGTVAADLAFSAPEDWRGHQVRFTFRFPNGVDSWVTAASSLQLRIGSGAAHESRFFLGDLILNAVDKLSWYQSHVDLDLDVASAVGNDGPCDFSAVQRLRLLYTAAGVGDGIDLDSITLINRSKQPAFCELGTSRVIQDSENPSGVLGPSYRASLEIREVLV